MLIEWVESKEENKNCKLFFNKFCILEQKDCSVLDTMIFLLSLYTVQILYEYQKFLFSKIISDPLIIASENTCN